MNQATSPLTVHLPESTLAFVNEQTAAQGYASPAEYVAALVAQAQWLTSPELEDQLLTGLDSGPSRPMTAADWDSLRERIHEQ
jgi:Arc/MetJ-type ribon-helix-helix transcriptional regulator